MVGRPAAVAVLLTGHPSPACQHAPDHREAAGPAEAQLPAQEPDRRAAGRLRCQKAVALRLEEDPGETHTSCSHTHTYKQSEVTEVSLFCGQSAAGKQVGGANAAVSVVSSSCSNGVGENREKKKKKDGRCVFQVQPAKAMNDTTDFLISCATTKWKRQILFF